MNGMKMNEWWRRRTLYGLLTFDGDDVMMKGCVLFNDEMRRFYFHVMKILRTHKYIDIVGCCIGYYTERGKEVRYQKEERDKGFLIIIIL